MVIPSQRPIGIGLGKNMGLASQRFFGFLQRWTVIGAFKMIAQKLF